MSAAILRSPQTQSSIRLLDAIARARARRALAAFEEFAAPLLGALWAVSFRGSHARGTATSYSDVDLLVITDHPVRREVLIAARRALRQAIGPSHIRISTIDDARDEPPGYLLLQSLPHIRFARGCSRLFGTWLNAVNDSLARLTGQELLDTLIADPLRRDDRMIPGSPHYDSIKHGPGGTIRYEIAACFAHYHDVQRRPVPLHLKRTMAAGRAAMTLQRLAKDGLERDAGVCVESLLPLKSGWQLEGMPASSHWRRLQYTVVRAARQRFEDFWWDTETYFREADDDG